MPQPEEQMYCSQQINIPPSFPFILKKFAKAAIRTQPYDLLCWSSDYFRALAENRVAPVKLRLEYPIKHTDGGFSCGYLRLLIKQFGNERIVPREYVEARWRGISLKLAELNRIFCLSDCITTESVDILKFVAVSSGYLTKSLTQTMILVCELLTEEPDGGNAGISVEEFVYMYKHLAQLDASKDVKFINGVREGDAKVDSSYKMDNDSDKDSIQMAELQEIIDVAKDNTEIRSEDLPEASTPPGVTAMNYNPLLGSRVPTEGGITSKSLTITAKPPRENFVKSPEEIKAETKSRKYLELDYVPSALDVSPTEAETEISCVRSESLDGGAGVTCRENIAQTGGNTTITATVQDDAPVTYKVYSEHGEVIESTSIEIEPIAENPGQSDKGDEMDEAELEADEASRGNDNREQAKSRKETKTYGKEYNDKVIDMLKMQKHNRIQEFEREMESLQELVQKTDLMQYDLGTITGRQMSTSSGEFIALKIRDEMFDNVARIIEDIPWPRPTRKPDPEAPPIVNFIVDKYFQDALQKIVPEESAVKEEAVLEQIITVYAVPGIGPAVDEDSVNEFVKYAQRIGVKQQGIFMPRNIRHFLCPPLENFTPS